MNHDANQGPLYAAVKCPSDANAHFTVHFGISAKGAISQSRIDLDLPNSSHTFFSYRSATFAAGIGPFSKIVIDEIFDVKKPTSVRPKCSFY